MPLLKLFLALALFGSALCLRTSLDWRDDLLDASGCGNTLCVDGLGGTVPHGTCHKYGDFSATQCNCHSGFVQSGPNHCVPAGCPSSDLQNVSALETAFPPAISSTGSDLEFAFGLDGDNNAVLNIAFEHPAVAQRKWTVASVAHDSSADSADEGMEYAHPGAYWTKSTSGCTDKWTGRLPLVIDDQTKLLGNDASNNYGFGPASVPDATAAEAVSYSSFLNVHEEEVATEFRGTEITRHIHSVFPLKITVATQIQVSDSVDVFAPINTLLAITGQAVDLSNPAAAIVTIDLVSQQQWPFQLAMDAQCVGVDGAGACTDEELYTHVFETLLGSIDGAAVGWAPAGDLRVSSRKFRKMSDEANCGTLATLESYQLGQPLCDQRWQLEFTADFSSRAHACRIDGTYKLGLSTACRANAFAQLNADGAATNANWEDVDCPIVTGSEGEGIATLSLASNDLCPAAEIDVTINGALDVYEDDTYTVLRDDFFVDTFAYYRAVVWSQESGVSVASVTLEEVSIEQQGNAALNTDGVVFRGNGPTETSAGSTCGAALEFAYDQGAGAGFTAPFASNPAAPPASSIDGASGGNAGKKIDFRMKAQPNAALAYTLNGEDQLTVAAVDPSCGLDLAVDGNTIMATSARLSVAYSGFGVRRTTHLSMGQGEEAKLLAVQRQQEDAGGGRASSAQTAEFVVSVPREGTQEPYGGDDDGAVGSAAAALSAFWAA